ncbi:MAG: hypothetical protein HZC45_06470 [Deltaproteobacteria bacterium]|nr:hypothetical protein [Deltaproteobacteria bacterium]
MRILLSLYFFILLTHHTVYAATDLTNPFSASMIPEVKTEDLEKAESHILKNARKGLDAKVLAIKDHAEILLTLLNVYKIKDNKEGIAKILQEVNTLSIDDLKFDSSEEKLSDGFAVIRLYTTAYRIKNNEIFKDNASRLLKNIEKLYFDNQRKGFFVKINGKTGATSTVNADAVITFLEASREFRDKHLEEIANSVVQYLKNILIKNGEAFHVLDPDKSRVYMDGQLSDNAITGIALLEIYKTFKHVPAEPAPAVVSRGIKQGDEQYLETAKAIAGFMQKRLYDEKFGGFIQRNSNSPENYPEGEELFINEKPFHENSIAAYFYQSLYEQTNNKTYKDIAAGTLGYLTSIYTDTPAQKQLYFITTLSDYLHAKKQDVDTAKKVDGIADKLSWDTKLPGTRLLPIIVLSFLAGVLSFLSPCTLPILPAYFAFTFQGEKSRILAMTFFFFLGLAMVFSLMGATASFIGSFLQSNISIITTIGGILIIIFGFMSLIGKGFGGAAIFKANPSTTLGGSFLFGAMLAFGWTACVGPILAGILVLAATEEGVIRGITLLFIYALGLSLPLMAISLFFKNMDKNGWFWRFLKGKGFEVNIFGTTLFLHSTSIISGIIFILLGSLMLSGYLAYINKILPLSTQVWFADIEDKLMEMIR